MALSYNLGYQESISVHPTRRQNFAGKVYSNFPNIWEWLIYCWYSSYIHILPFFPAQRKRQLHGLNCKWNVSLNSQFWSISTTTFLQNYNITVLKGCLTQRPKKSKLSGWQLSTRKNFPDEVRKSFSRQKKRVNHFRDKKVCVNCFCNKKVCSNHFCN